MENNSGDEAQSPNIFVNQPTQRVQAPSTPNVVQPTVPPVQTKPSFQPPTMNQQPEVILSNSEDKSKSVKKKIMLLFVGLILLMVLVVVGLFALLTPTVRGLSACMEENSRNVELLIQRGVAEGWNNQQKCIEIKPINEELIACYESVGDSSLLPEQLAFTLGGLISSSVKDVDKESIIEQHNSNCSQFLETLLSN